MNKIMMLALSVAATAMFALPATASASLESVSLHMSPTPAKLDIAGVGGATLRSSGGNITCTGVSGSATPEAGGTTGTLRLTFGPHCTGPTGETCTSSNPAEVSGSIETTALSYHLVTLWGSYSGLLVTPSNFGAFAHFNCNVFGFPIQSTIEGNGLLGTIPATAPGCGVIATTTTVDFNSGAGTIQEHRQVKGGTESTIWSLTKGGESASLEAHVTLTATNIFSQVMSSKLGCT